MRYLAFLFLLMVVFISLFLISAPQILYSHTGGSSHTHPHDPEKAVCVGCAELVTPGSHYCVKDQEQDVKISNVNAELKRFEGKFDDANDNGIADALEDTVDDELGKPQKILKRIIKVITGQAGSVKCQGCGNWVSHEKEHWGTGGCAIGHKHWTCIEAERWAHAGCYWVNEPETNPDSIYEGSKYSVSCPACGNTRWTNSYDEYMDWQNNSYCHTCRSMYGH